MGVGANADHWSCEAMKEEDNATKISKRQGRGSLRAPEVSEQMHTIGHAEPETKQGIASKSEYLRGEGFEHQGCRGKCSP